MKIKNLKVGEKVKKLAPYVLIGTLTFAGCKTFIKNTEEKTMPVYEMDVMDSNGGFEITEYTPSYGEDAWDEKPQNRIVEYTDWLDKEDHWEREVKTYDLDNSEFALILELTRNEFTVDKYFRPTKTEIETKSERQTELPYKEGFYYHKKDDRKFTKEELKEVNKRNNLSALIYSIPLDGMLMYPYYAITGLAGIYRKRKEKQLVK